jgi:hypothetical protein
MGYQCDAFYHNPNYNPDSDNPLLLRCNDPATVRLVINTTDDTYSIKRCDICADVLRARVEMGATFEILSEEAI